MTQSVEDETFYAWIIINNTSHCYQKKKEIINQVFEANLGRNLPAILIK